MSATTNTTTTCVWKRCPKTLRSRPRRSARIARTRRSLPCDLVDVRALRFTTALRLLESRRAAKNQSVLRKSDKT